MGMDLHSAAGEFWWDSFSWAKLLRVAERYGWRPTGTRLSEADLADMPGGRWDGNYTTNDDQTVTAEDARALAAALERAVHDISSRDVIAHHRDASGGIRLAPNPPAIDDLDWFCGPERNAQIRAFTTYCQAGEFLIS